MNQNIKNNTSYSRRVSKQRPCFFRLAVVPQLFLLVIGDYIFYSVGTPCLLVILQLRLFAASSYVTRAIRDGAVIFKFFGTLGAFD